MKKPVPEVVLKVLASGKFIALVDGRPFEGTLDRDARALSGGLKWKRGSKPADAWTQEAIEQAVGYLIGLMPRVRG